MDNNISSKVYSIVVTYNGMQWIKRCLSSLVESSLPTNIIVIDNLSIDGTPEYIEQNFPQVDLIRSDVNLGFGKGNNIGMKKAIEAKADYIFLLNQDAWIKKETIEQLVIAQKNNTMYGVLSPIHLNGSGECIERKFEEYAGPDNTPGLLSDLFMGSEYKQVYRTRFVNAAAWLISGECLNAVGLFNPIFPHYGEDEDYLNRVRFLEYSVGICPKAIIFHDREFSWDKIKFNPNRLFIAELIKLVNVNTSLRSALILFMKTSFDSCTSALIFRKFKTLKLKLMVFFKVIYLVPSISKARKFNCSNKSN